MYIVTVNFSVKTDKLQSFTSAMLQQAKNSMSMESGCHQFDVCFDPEQENHCFLYEVYDDRAAFEEHLQSAHFIEFDALVTNWIESKAVASLTRCWPD